MNTDTKTQATNMNVNTTINTIAVIGLGVYMIITAIGNALPNTKIGKLCLRFGAIIIAIEKALPQEKQASLKRGQNIDTDPTLPSN